MNGPILGLATAIYNVPDMPRAKAWYSEAFQQQPYFDEPFYVGFNVGGFELGLDPDPSSVKRGGSGGVAYWGVEDADRAFARLLDLGAGEVSGVRDVGGGIKVATLSDPFGTLIGIIENPHVPNTSG